MQQLKQRPQVLRQIIKTIILLVKNLSKLQNEMMMITMMTIPIMVEMKMICYRYFLVNNKKHQRKQEKQMEMKTKEQQLLLLLQHKILRTKFSNNNNNTHHHHKSITNKINIVSIKKSKSKLKRKKIFYNFFLSI